MTEETRKKLFELEFRIRALEISRGAFVNTFKNKCTAMRIDIQYLDAKGSHHWQHFGSDFSIQLAKDDYNAILSVYDAQILKLKKEIHAL